MASVVEWNKQDGEAAGAAASGQLLLDGVNTTLRNLSPLQPRGDSGPVPLSFAQERLWFLDQIAPGDASANISRGLKITGELNYDLLRQSLQTLVSRHESLRTTFATMQLYAGVDSKPAQFITNNSAVELAVTNLSSIPIDQQMLKARGLAQAEAQHAFELTIGPLLRATLLMLAPDEHVLLLTAHRIISDDRSLDLLVRELLQVYDAGVSGEDPQLPSLPIQFADYASWQRNWSDAGNLRTESDYWTATLRGAPAVLELPGDRSRPAVQHWRGASVSLVLDEGLSQELFALAQVEQTSLFVLLMTAFQILLARYSGRTDIVTGSQFANRELAETRNLIGPLANAFALRTDLSSDPAFRELLARVQKNAEKAAAHQLMPFERLVEEMQLERSMSYAPIFQVALNLRETSSFAAPTTSLPGLLIEEFAFETGVARLDLTLDVRSGDEIEFRFKYASDLFDRETIARMSRHLEVLLRGIVSNPAERISTLPLLSSHDLQTILFEWNASTTERETGQCIHEAFEAVAERMAQAVAVVCGAERLTYHELNVRANQLARYLQKRGVGPEKRVGICLGRTTEMVIAVLAILKAGGAYVPLDPAYPAERLAFTLEDSDACVLLTSEELSATLPKTNARKVFVASEWPAIDLEDATNLPALVQPENLAYVIYTSGSTGQPKGVAIEHRSTVAFLNWALATFSREELAGVLLSTSLCFDLSVFELFAPLCAGGKVILVENALQLPDLTSGEVTLVNTVPSAMSELIRIGGLPGSVRTINLAGEPLLKSVVDDLYACQGVQQVLNLYGPSEDTTYSTFVRLPKGLTEEPTIGRPVANSSAYVLDAHLQPVPVGVPGELHLGGAGLARGYLKRAALTAEKFVPDPFSSKPGARMYKTGDLARYQPEGTIQFLGRLDHQVKLRGYRIELGEIETVLSRHPHVEQAVVIVREDQPGDKRLVAYVVPRLDESEAGSKEEATRQLSASLRSLLAQKLPEYMMPSAFVMLEALPLTPNGKVDRRSLPKPDAGRGALEHTYLAPRDNLERQLANIWEKILDVKSVGVEDSFFELGGNSLLAVRLFAQIENRFGKRLPLSALFQAPTIGQLASALRDSESSKAWSSLVAIQPHGSKAPLYCIHAAGANVLIYRPLARHLGLDQPVFALQARGLDGQEQPFLHVEDMAAHYIREVRAFQPQGPYHLLGASFGGLVIFEMAHQLRAQGQQVGVMAMLNTNCPVYPASRKIRFHLAHLREHGLKFYASAIWETLKRKMGRPTVSVEVTAAPDPELARLVADSRHGDEALVRTVLAILDAEKDYVPRGKIYPGKITLFWAADAAADSEDNRLGWEKLAAGGLEVHEVPGTHISIREEPHVAVVAERLRRCLEAEQA